MFFLPRRSSESGDSAASLLDTERGALAREEYVLSRQEAFTASAREHVAPYFKSARQNFVPGLIFLLPSFLTTQQKKPSPNAIAALDGLRGYASLGVFTLHFTDTFCQMHNRGWGYDDQSFYIIQLPFIHFFWTANSLVACFFVISGYVLSHKPLKLIYARSDEAFFQTMRSAIFRRGIRLYVPCVLATFIAFLMVRVGIFDYPHWVFENGYTRGSEDTPPILPTFGAQFRDWSGAMWDMTFLFKWGGGAPGYDPHLFTIPTEFQGSVALFFVTLGVGHLRTAVRMTFVAMLILYCAWFDVNEILLFFLGMLLADADILLRRISREGNDYVKRLRFLWLVIFIPGWYLVGMPAWDPEVTPGYVTLMKIMPAWFRWQTIGCGLLVWSVRNSTDLDMFFTNKFAQYLGNISFALYIVHGNVRRTVSYAVIPSLNEWTGATESRHGYAVMVAVNTLCTYVVAIWLADLWWRGVDIPSIKLARWVEGKCTRKEVEYGGLGEYDAVSGQAEEIVSREREVEK